MILQDETFEKKVQKASEPVRVDFWATSCPPCHAQAPVIEQLTADFAGRAKVAKLDVDANPAAAQQHGIKSIPTGALFKDGNVVHRFVGVKARSELAAVLNELLAQASHPPKR